MTLAVARTQFVQHCKATRAMPRCSERAHAIDGPADTTRELQVLRHCTGEGLAQRISMQRGCAAKQCAWARTDGHALGVDSAQVAVLEQLDHEVFHGLQAVRRVTSAIDTSARDAKCTHLLQRQQRLRGPAVRVIRQVVCDFAHLRVAGCVSAPGTAAAEAALPSARRAVRARGPVPALLPRPRGTARGSAPGGRRAACGPVGRWTSGTCESPSAHACLAGSGTACVAWRCPRRQRRVRLHAGRGRRVRQRLARGPAAGCSSGHAGQANYGASCGTARHAARPAAASGVGGARRRTRLLFLRLLRRQLRSAGKPGRRVGASAPGARGGQRNKRVRACRAAPARTSVDLRRAMARHACRRCALPASTQRRENAGLGARTPAPANARYARGVRSRCALCGVWRKRARVLPHASVAVHVTSAAVAMQRRAAGDETTTRVKESCCVTWRGA